MPVTQPTETLNLVGLMRGLAKYTQAQRDAQERDVVVPTPQQQSAARKRALLERARQLGILNEVVELPREELTRRVNRETTITQLEANRRAAGRVVEDDENENEDLDIDTF